MALILALGVMSVLAISTVSVVTYTSSSERNSNRSEAKQSAQHLAEAGVNNAASLLAGSGDPTNATLLTPSPGVACPDPAKTCFEQTYEGGRTLWYGTYDAVGADWHVTSWGLARNPVPGSAEIQHSLVAEIHLDTVSIQEPNAAAWNFAYSTATGGNICHMDVNGSNVVIDVPVYVAGNLCLSGSNAKIVEVSGGQAVTVTVLGKLILSGSNVKLGESNSKKITSAAVGVGCSSSLSGSTSTCNATNWPGKWYVGTTGSLDAIEAPVADYQAAYDSAAPGPNNDCATSSNPPHLASTVFDNNTTMDASVTTTFELTPSSSSYQCRFYQGSTLVGELSWSHSANTLTVSGKIFIDGTVRSSDDEAQYNGKATLYVNRFTMNGSNDNLCAVISGGACNFNTWDPNAEMLMIVARGHGGGNAIELNGSNVQFQGALHTNPTETISLAGSNVEMHGPLVGGHYGWGSNTVVKPLPVVNSLPPGAPLTPNVQVQPGPARYTG